MNKKAVDLRNSLILGIPKMVVMGTCAYLFYVVSPAKWIAPEVDMKAAFAFSTVRIGINLIFLFSMIDFLVSVYFTRVRSRKESKESKPF